MTGPRAGGNEPARGGPRGFHDALHSHRVVSFREIVAIAIVAGLAIGLVEAVYKELHFWLTHELSRDGTDAAGGARAYRSEGTSFITKPSVSPP